MLFMTRTAFLFQFQPRAEESMPSSTKTHWPKINGSLCPSSQAMATGLPYATPLRRAHRASTVCGDGEKIAFFQYAPSPRLAIACLGKALPLTASWNERGKSEPSGWVHHPSIGRDR